MNRAVPVEAGFARYALSVGDVNRDEAPEIYALASRIFGGSETACLLGWSVKGEKMVEIPLPDSEAGKVSAAALTVGDLTFEAGDDVLVGVKPNRLLLYSWKDKGLELLRDFSILTPGITINAVGFADTDSDNRHEIIVAGAASTAITGGGRFYLEVLGFRELAAEIFPKWKRVGGEAEEGEVTFFEIARK